MANPIVTDIEGTIFEPLEINCVQVAAFQNQGW